MCILICNLFEAKWVIKLFCAGYEMYKQELCGQRLRPVCACAQIGQSLYWSSMIRLKKRTFTDEVKARHRHIEV